MVEKTYKPLVIKSKTNQPANSTKKWDVIKEFPNFISTIDTPNLESHEDGTSKVDIASIVSGMPTVFARANLFRDALVNARGKDEEATSLNSFYRFLINEWRGLISCVALNYKDIEVDRLNLQYSDGKEIFETENIYEPLGAFGNMLFERKPLWCDHTLATTAGQIPFIDVIIFKGKVI
jgi:hypothetical protein